MRRRQRGSALLIAVGLLGLLAMATLARALSAPPGAEAALATERALARAREALVAYGALGNAAGSHDNSPGALPCPDLDNDGVSDLNCGAHIGRLPWRTLGLGPLLDGAGECLWYARSPRYSNNIQTSERGTSADKPALNPATAGEIIEVNAEGTTGRRLAAVVIAPGLPLPGQQRGAVSGLSGCRSGDLAQFLEDVEVGGTPYPHSSGLNAVMLLAVDGFNDSVLGMDTPRLFATAGARVLGDIQLAGGTPPHVWWTQNLWCTQVCVTATSGRITLAEGGSVSRALGVFPACASPCSGT
jgi:type II secretory pathway pseudopilin PulG